MVFEGATLYCVSTQTQVCLEDGDQPRAWIGTGEGDGEHRQKRLQIRQADACTDSKCFVYITPQLIYFECW